MLETIKTLWMAALVKRYKSDPSAEYYAPVGAEIKTAQLTVNRMMDNFTQNPRSAKGALRRNPALKAAAKKAGIKYVAEWEALFNA